MASDLFGEKPIRPRRVMAHFTDAGTDTVEFECSKCGWNSGHIFWKKSVSEAKRGIPCEACTTEIINMREIDVTDIQCDEFRAMPLSFNEMVREIYRCGEIDGRNRAIEDCAVAAENNSRSGHEFLRGSVWDRINRETAIRIRELSS